MGYAAHVKCNLWSGLEVKKSKVKVTRPCNAETENVPQITFNPLKGRGVKWLHFAIQV